MIITEISNRLFDLGYMGCTAIANTGEHGKQEIADHCQMILKDLNMSYTVEDVAGRIRLGLGISPRTTSIKMCYLTLTEYEEHGWTEIPKIYSAVICKFLDRIGSSYTVKEIRPDAVEIRRCE